MISLTNFDGDIIYVEPSHIVAIEATPTGFWKRIGKARSRLYLIGGSKVLVLENAMKIRELQEQHRA